MATYTKLSQADKEMAKLEREERFKKLWLEQVPALVRGLTESEYLVFENMFEMLADLREEAYFLRYKEMPTLSYTFDRSVKICAVKKKHRLDKELT